MQKMKIDPYLPLYMSMKLNGLKKHIWDHKVLKRMIEENLYDIDLDNDF